MSAPNNKPCFCACHEYPGTYPTAADKPCGYCAHINDGGQMLGTSRDGWTRTRDVQRGRDVATSTLPTVDRLLAAAARDVIDADVVDHIVAAAKLIDDVGGRIDHAAIYSPGIKAVIGCMGVVTIDRADEVAHNLNEYPGCVLLSYPPEPCGDGCKEEDES
jgi:hypothetical protein